MKNLFFKNSTFNGGASKDIDADGFNCMRTNLVGDFEDDILEIGIGTGATFVYYGPKAEVTAIKPDDEIRVAAEEAVKNADTKIKVIPVEGERLPFKNETIDSISTSLVLCM